MRSHRRVASTVSLAFGRGGSGRRAVSPAAEEAWLGGAQNEAVAVFASGSNSGSVSLRGRPGDPDEAVSPDPDVRMGFPDVRNRCPEIAKPSGRTIGLPLSRRIGGASGFAGAALAAAV